MSDEIKDPQPDPKPEEKLTGEQMLELEKLRAQRVADEKVIEELKARDRDNNVKHTISKSIRESGIKSHFADDELFTLLSKQDGVEINVSGDGRELIVEKNGKRIEFRELVEQHAVKNQHMYDGRTIRSLIESNNAAAITSKEDLKTTEEKVAWIQKHGADAYERLGMFKVPSLDASKLTASDWKNLTIAQKTKVVEQHGENVVSKILRRTEKK
jgi:hypothetical protein